MAIDMITMDELCRTINYSGCYLFPKNIEKALLDLIPAKYSEVEELHYCWSQFRQCHRLELKIKPTDEFYSKMAEGLFDIEKYVFLAIDADCVLENRMMLIEIEKLLVILKKYYWELDEIYISSMKFDWLISVNHTFEFNFIGDGLIEFMKKSIINNQIQSLIIDMVEYK